MSQNKFLFWFFNTNEDKLAVFLRIVVGVVIFPHGAQKLLGWFGGYGFDGTMGFFTQTLGIPYLFALLAIIAEFFGGLGLITGLLTRLSAFGVASVMFVAVMLNHIPVGFFMNWSGQQQGEGFEYHILMIALTIAVIVKGAGSFSLDKFILQKFSKQ
ncbi:MAG: DoxX family protein [Ignavibacteriales bacterium]|nr:DoxX family protein [Ignavibacteriales bacterium]